MGGRGYWVWVICLGMLEAGTSQAEPTARTTSESRQFLVEAPEIALSMQISDSAERLKKQILTTFQLRDHWRSVIYITVCENPTRHDASAITITPYALGGRLQFSLRAETPPPLDQADFFRALTQVLMSEQVNRNRASVRAGETLVTVPPWLTEGLWQDIAENAVHITTRANNQLLLRRALAANRTLTWDQILTITERPKETVPAQLFSAHSQAFFEALLTLPDGQKKLQRYLEALPTSVDSQQTFREVFRTDFVGEQQWSKWWSVRLLAAAQKRQQHALSLTETRRLLEETLPTLIAVTDKKLGVGQVKSVSVIELGEYRQMQGMDEQLAHKAAELLTLQIMANPIYREPILGYSQAIESLRQRQFKQYVHQVNAAQKLHLHINEIAQGVVEVINEIEHRESPGLTLSFSPRFRALQEPALTAPMNSIGGFLDKIGLAPVAEP